MSAGGGGSTAAESQEPIVLEKARRKARSHAAYVRFVKLLGLTTCRRVLARISTAAWVCALLAVLNAVCWSLITPPFLAVDEQDHFSYVQQLAETGSLPSSALSEYSPEERLALDDLHHDSIRFDPVGHPIFTLAEQRKLQSDLAGSASRSDHGGAGVAASEPPLYYALETIPYAVGSSGSILDRLELMRLLSALMAGFTVLFAFLFLREVLPRVRWAWTVGGLGIALAPLLAFSSSTVNPDALLFTISAALFYCLARAFRRGLTRQSSTVIGLLMAFGFLTKLNFAGLAAGAILGLIMLARRSAQRLGPSVYLQTLAPALLIALSPGILYGLVNMLSNHSTFGIVSANIMALVGSHGSIFGELSYMWQFYLPRLPGMHSDFGEIFTPRQIWLRNMIGLYGWGDTPFPNWVYNVTLIPLSVIVALCIRSLVISRAAIRLRSAELVTYTIMTVGLMVLVASSGYLHYPSIVAEFTDARYAVPLLALWGGVLALAARGAGRAWGPVAGVLIVITVLAHDIFSQLQVIGRYYH